MDFKEALFYLKLGYQMKLPSWCGYWTWDKEKETIMMYTKDGEVLDIRETQRVDYTLENILSDEWGFARDEDTPILGGVAYMSFGDAIKLVKRGLKLARKGWNGKNQYIELATNVSYKNTNDEVVNVDHSDMGNKTIAFVGTSGVQLGWLAYQADMLSDDWRIVK